MNRKNAVTIGVIIFAAVGVVTYSWSKNEVKPNPSVSPTVSASPTASPSPTITSTSTPQPSVTPTPSVDVSDWKTYKNETMGIEFKYPSTFIINEQVINNVKTTYLWTKDDYNLYKTGKYSDISPFLWVQTETLNGLTLEKWIESKKTDISEKEYVNFGNLRFLRIYEQGYGKGTYLYYAVQGNNIFTLGTSANKTDSILNKIISTFRIN